MQPIAPILAIGVEQIVQVLIFLAPLIYFVLKLQGQGEEKQPPPEQPQGKVPKPDPVQAEAARPQGNPGDRSLREEIEVFLKRVAEQRETQRPADVEVLHPARQEPAVAARHDTPVQAEIVEVVPRDVGPLVGGSVAAHVEQHIDTGRIQAHASHLGEEVGYADEKLEARLHEKFDHAVGRLGASATDSLDGSRSSQDSAEESYDKAYEEVPLLVAESLSDAAKIAALLKNPAGVRQAVILNEVLRRPDERW